jgi:uncharacterized protein (UPF0276 family)
MLTKQIQGIGLGFRRPYLPEIIQQRPNIDFFEFAPENWLGVGGKRKRELSFLIDNYPVLAHGLSLSIGGLTPLDKAFLKRLKSFLDENSISIYSEHLSYSSDHGHLYELLPIPFTEESVYYVATRIKQVQDILQRRIALENVSYYLMTSNELSELEFINAVLQEADCDFLLDVNNVYVNSINHQYDPKKFIQQLNPKNIAYLHIAGHWQKNRNLIIDSHGENIVNKVWELLDFTYARFGVLPTLLERDNNLPTFEVILKELERIKAAQKACLANDRTNFSKITNSIYKAPA